MILWILPFKHDPPLSFLFVSKKSSVLEEIIFQMESSSEIENLLTQSNVLISDVENVRNKISTFQQDSCKNLKVVADFDFTLTHCFDKDSQQKLLTSFGAVEFDSRFPDDFRNRLLDLYHHYAPIDADPNIEQETKVKLVEEWNKKASEVYRSETITKEIIKNAVSVARLKLRGGFNLFANTLSHKQVPFLILSAGLGDSIVCVLENTGVEQNDIKVISNFFTFDNNGLVTGTTKPLITTGSKGKRTGELHNQYFESVSERKNVILLGDRIEDLQMADAYGETYDTLLTIGFLNEKVEEEKDLYLRNYDVVLLGDPDLSWTQKLMDIV